MILPKKMTGTMTKLVEKKCQPCVKGAQPFSLEESKASICQIPGWTLSGDAKLISREFVMKDFISAVDLIQKISDIAEREDHHPDLHLTGYRKLRIELSTHSIGGLSGNDFILAAKIDSLPKELKK